MQLGRSRKLAHPGGIAYASGSISIPGLPA